MKENWKGITGDETLVHYFVPVKKFEKNMAN